MLLEPGDMFRQTRAQPQTDSSAQQTVELGEVCVTLRVLLLEHTVGATGMAYWWERSRDLQHN
jgi:hypothetical protein